MASPVRRVAGSVVVPTLNEPVALSTHPALIDADEVLSIIFQNPPTNKGKVYTGIEGMSDTDSWTIQVNEQSPAETYRNVLAAGGFVQARDIFFDVEVSGERINFIAILQKR